VAEEKEDFLTPEKRRKRIEELEKLMTAAARKLEFEKAAQYRDELNRLKKRQLELMERD